MFTTPIVQILDINKVDISIFVSATVSSTWNKSIEDLLSEECRAYAEIMFVIFIVILVWPLPESTLDVSYPTKKLRYFSFYLIKLVDIWSKDGSAFEAYLCGLLVLERAFD